MFFLGRGKCFFYFLANIYLEANNFFFTLFLYRGVVVIFTAHHYSTKSPQFQILLVACRRLAMVRISTNGTFSKKVWDHQYTRLSMFELGKQIGYAALRIKQKNSDVLFHSVISKTVFLNFRKQLVVEELSNLT